MSKVTIPKINTLLDFGIFLFTIKAGYDLSGIISPGLYIDYAVIGIGLMAFIFAILKQGYSVALLCKYALIAMISLVSTILSGQSAIIVTVITILAVRNSDISIIIEKIYKWSCAFFIINSIYFGILLLFNQVQIYTIDAQGRSRASFGFNHANSFSVYVFNMILMWCWINFDKIKTKDITIIFVIETILYFFSGSKTFYSCAIIFCILLLIIKRKNSNWIHVFAKTSVPVLTGILFYLFFSWKNANPFIYLLDTMLTGRIKLGAYAFLKYGITLLGQKLDYGILEWTTEWRMNYFTLDSTYTSLMMNIGVVWLIIIIAGFIKLANLKDRKISIFIIMWSLYAITEVHGLNVYLFFPILLLSLLFCDREPKLKV